MNTATAPRSLRASMLSYLSLFTSVGTLLCCALPSLLVLFGLGASVASTLSFFPWLVTLSRHKQWTFAVAGILIGLSFVNKYYIAPRVGGQNACGPEDSSACRDASRVGEVLLWISAAIYGIGFFVAYILGPVLARIDR
jgi:mercuric ion transport protein